MDEIISLCGAELGSFLEKNKDLIKLCQLIRKLNSLSQVSKQPYSKSRCLYEAVSEGVSINFMEHSIGEFFSPLQKPVGKNPPLLLRFNKTVRMLRGIRKNQSFFLRKTDAGEVYGALWPWQSESQKITILLGFNGDGINDAEYQQLEELVENISRQKP